MNLTRRQNIRHLMVGSLTAALPIGQPSFLQAQDEDPIHQFLKQPIRNATARYIANGAPFQPFLIKPTAGLNYLFSARGGDGSMNY